MKKWKKIISLFKYKQEKSGRSFLGYAILFIPFKVKRFFLLKYGFDFLIRHNFFKEMIADQRILILGSGPSAKDLCGLPPDVKLFTCNTSMSILINKKISRKIDLYTCSKAVFLDYEKKGVNVFELLSEQGVICFVTNSIKFCSNYLDKYGIKVKLLKDFNKNNFYLRKLIHPLKLVPFISNRNMYVGVDEVKWTSTGIRLLQYCLYYGAKEIYLIGIDMSEDHPHSSIDNDFMKIISKKHKNIYSVSKTSPITKYIKHKKLE